MGERGLNRKRISAYFGSTDPMSGPHRGLRLHGPRSRVNVADDFRQIERVVGQLPPILRDLVDIASAAYTADMFLPPDSSFYRELQLTVEVRDRAAWEPLLDLVQGALTFLMQSPFRIQLTEGKEEGPSLVQDEPRRTFHSVACFSGGLDSYAGAASLATKPDNYLLVSQFNNPQLAGLEARAASGFLTGRESCAQMRIDVGQRRGLGRGGLGSQEYSVQPTRSFLFLALAGAAAIQTGARNLYMFENGPIALGVPYTQARYTTRTVHPIFLDYVQEILRRIPGGEDLVVTNPFQSMTKAEVISTIDEARFGEGMRRTASCSHRWRVHLLKSKLGKPDFAGWHCGLCLPCIHRRIGMLRAGVSELDDDDYLVDILAQYPFDGMPDPIAAEALINVRDLMVFAAQFGRRPATELYELYPELYFETERMSMAEVVDVYRRMAVEVLDVFRSHGNDRLADDSKRATVPMPPRARNETRSPGAS